jgi:hypothetical protein
MTPEDRALVVVLRKTQWLLDEAAYDIPGERYRIAQHHELADMLTALSAMVRARATDRAGADGDADPASPERKSVPPTRKSPEQF